MFWKRKEEQPPQQRAANTQAPRPGTPTGVGKFTTVIVPRSALVRAADPEKAYDLVKAVVDFVNTMMGDGLYTRNEIPAKALQAYHADYYLAQVNNGGHSQFIHNCSKNLSYIAADVHSGLTGMKAEKHLQVFEQMGAWIVQNRDEASKQTGFSGGRASLLDELDRTFYATEKETPMIRQSAVWIASWPELRPVDDADYKEAMHRSAMMNPLREPRLMVRSVANLTQQMTTWFYVGVGLACTNASPPEVKLALGGGAVYDIEGKKQTAFAVRTNMGKRFCVVTDEHAAAYEMIDDNPPMPKIGDVEGMLQAMKDGRLAQYKGLAAGRKLSQIDPKTIAGFIELAKEYRAPAALDLLLRKARIDPKDAAVSPAAIMPASGGPAINCLVVVGGQALIAQSSPAGSVLLRTGDHTQLARAPKSDIAEHAARVEASAPKLD